MWWEGPGGAELGGTSRSQLGAVAGGGEHEDGQQAWPWFLRASVNMMNTYVFPIFADL